MTLEKLLTAVQPSAVNGPLDQSVSGLAYDSRRVEPGYLFFALPGVKVDGFDFIPQALQNGTTVIVAEREWSDPPAGCCAVTVADARLAMAKMSAVFYAQPSCGVPVIGVTGTNGKTTITYLLEAILKQGGYRPAVFGTIDYRYAEQRHSSSHTTPESLELIRMMREFRDLGANAFILEASSHALEQHRVDGIDFDAAVFTNLTAEHLDYHHNLENYFASKKRLFTELLGSGKAIINADDSFGARLLQENCSRFAYGRQANADLHPVDITVARNGIHGVFGGRHGRVAVSSALIGDFNVSNLLAAVAAAQELGISNPAIQRGIEAMSQVPGRVEVVANDKGVLALVDYAHTGDALEQVLKTLQTLEHKRLITVVGCGGDRDPSKRPVMAQAAVGYSDVAIFTSDNPRTEDPLKILEQIKAGALAAGSVELPQDEAMAGTRGFVMIPERRRAIEFACRLATAGDLLLVAGKGHEDYQILGSTKIHFDDREELKRAFDVPDQPESGGA